MNQETTFGSIVKERRHQLGLTQTELARRANCAAITVRKIEADAMRPSVQIAEHLAVALNIPEEEHLAFIRLARAERDPSPLPTPEPILEEIGLEDLTGRAIRGFELGERIGTGGYGVVYRATQSTVEREVAIKIILPKFADRPEFIRRFEAEAQLVARLEHPHIVPLYDYWREPGVAYLIMRMLRGGSLEDHLNNGPMALETVLPIMEQICAGLHASHRAGVIHRDIKPANILLDDDGNAYLADFGIAKLVGNGTPTEATIEGTVIGSPAYISPEQILAEPVKPQTDIYSVGVVLYELLTGHKPFKGPTPFAYIQQHLNEPLPLLAVAQNGEPATSSASQPIPTALDIVIGRATAKDARERYPDILTMLADLRQAMKPGSTAADMAGSQTIEKTPAHVAAMIDLPELENPYKGLRAFTEADAADFFGRQTLIQDLLTLLSEANDPLAGSKQDLARFLAVVGPSGSGKSSVVRAGLIPVLREGGLPDSEKWFVVEMLPGAHPLEELEAALLRVAVNPPESLLAQLKEDERGLLRATRRILPVDEDVELVLVIDQFEEVFTLVTDQAVRQHFLDSLVTAILDSRSRLRVVITLRADFTDQPLRYIDFGDLVRQRTEFVLPLMPDELEQAIVGPTERAGLRLEPELVPTIIREIGDQPGTLPLLQYALTELFERREGRKLTVAAYRESGGVLGALARRADELYQGLDESGQEMARQLFLRLVTLGEGTEDTRRRVLRSELASLTADHRPSTAEDSNDKESAVSGLPSPVIDEVINAFGRYRLLTFDRDPVTRRPTIEVAHEALLREWSRLRGWLDENRSDVRLQRLLASAAQEWLGADQDSGYLLRGSRLDQFEDWAASTNVALTQNERAYLEASLAARQERQAAEEARLQRELETAQKLAETEKQRAEEQTQAATRLRRRAIFLTGALVVAGILAVVAVIFGQQATQNEQQAVAEAEQRATAQANAEQEREIAQQQREEAQTQTNLATSRELSLAALNNMEADPELSMLLAMQALNTSYTKEAEEALHQGIQASRVLKTLSGHTNQVWHAVYSPDGAQVATISDDGTVKVWDAASGQLLQTMPYQGIDSLGGTLMYDDTGSRVSFVAIGANYESVILHIWNVSSGELLIQKELPVPLENWSLALSPDWEYMVAGRENGTAELWDVETAEKLLTLSGHEDVVKGVSFSTDGSRLATSSRNGQVQVWDVEASVTDEQGQLVIAFETPTQSKLGKSFFSVDGTRLALIFTDSTAEVWDLADISQPPIFLEGHTNWVQYAAFHPNSSWVATAAGDGTAKVWDLTTGEELFTLSGHKGFVHRLTFSPDGRRLATASQDGTARIWNTEPQADGEMFTFASSGTIDVMDMELSPDEQKVALGNNGGPATVWDTTTGKQLLTLSGEANTRVYRVSFNPDGSRLATVGQDGIVRIWDAETGDLLLDFTGHIGGNAGGRAGTLDVAYSPDGLQLATAGADGIAKVWDAATGEELLAFDGHTAGLQSLAYSPDSRYIATSSDEGDTTIKVWDTHTGSEVYTLGPNPGRAWGLSFSPDGSLLAAGGQGGYLKVWDMTTGTELVNMTGQSATIGTVAFTQDGTRLITGGVESTSIWDIATGTELLNLAPKNSWKVALTQDGRRLYSADFLTPAVRVYTVSLEDTVALAHSRVTRSLTAEECRQYLHMEECPAGF